MRQRCQFLLLGCALVLVVVVVLACQSVQTDRSAPAPPNASSDPVTMDPPARDSAFPARMADHDGLVAALQRAGARRLTALTWDTDHSFSDRRIALARTVVDWLRSSCA